MKRHRKNTHHKKNVSNVGTITDFMLIFSLSVTLFGCTQADWKRRLDMGIFVESRVHIQTYQLRTESNIRSSLAYKHIYYTFSNAHTRATIKSFRMSQFAWFLGLNWKETAQDQAT